MIREQGFKSIGALTHFCRGGIVGGPVKHQQGYMLSGLTLAFDNPSASVTFTGNNPLKLSDVADQVATQTSNAIRVVVIDGCIGFVEAEPTTGIVVGVAVQSALAVLGLNKQGGLVGTVLNPPGAAYGPYYVSVSHNNSSHTLVYDDAYSSFSTAPTGVGIEVANPAGMATDMDIDPPTRAVYIGSAGDLVVLKARDTVPVTYSNAPVGMMPISIKKLYKTTTATLLVLEK